MKQFTAKLLKPGETGMNLENRRWWEENPMLYDWEEEIAKDSTNRAFFDAIDTRFAEATRLCSNPNWPDGYILENFIPYRELKGKQVLEIGCGAGLVASHLAKAGAELCAVDLTGRAVTLTRRRFGLENLPGTIFQMDAESLAFAEESFDHVVSWGVIHHSGNMQAIIREIHRVLKPGGRAHIMIYSRKSLRYRVYCLLWLGIMRGRLGRESLDEIAGSITDGAFARHLTEDEFARMVAMFRNIDFSYSDEAGTISGYLLGPFHRLLRLFPYHRPEFERWLSERWGWYMQIVLEK